MIKLYIDTNVIIDAVEGRRNKQGFEIGNPASDLFHNAILCKYFLIISTWTLEELSGLGKLETTKMFFELSKNKIISVRYTPEEKELSKQSYHGDDALHIIIAEREKADYIVTRNIIHFEEIGTPIPILKPEAPL